MNDIDPITAADHAPPAIDFHRTPLMKNLVHAAHARRRSVSSVPNLQQIPRQDLHGLHGVSFDEILKAVTFAAESKGLTAKQFVCNNLAASFEAENEAARRVPWQTAQIRELHKKNAALTKLIGRYSLIIRSIDSLNAAIARLHDDDTVPADVKREFRHKSDRVPSGVFMAGVKASAAHALCTARLERSAVQEQIKRVRGVE